MFSLDPGRSHRSGSRPSPRYDVRCAPSCPMHTSPGDAPQPLLRMIPVFSMSDLSQAASRGLAADAHFPSTLLKHQCVPLQLLPLPSLRDPAPRICQLTGWLAAMRLSAVLHLHAQVLKAVRDGPKGLHSSVSCLRCHSMVVREVRDERCCCCVLRVRSLSTGRGRGTEPHLPTGALSSRAAAGTARQGPSAYHSTAHSVGWWRGPCVRAKDRHAYWLRE